MGGKRWNAEGQDILSPKRWRLSKYSLSWRHHLRDRCQSGQLQDLILDGEQRLRCLREAIQGKQHGGHRLGDANPPHADGRSHRARIARQCFPARSSCAVEFIQRSGLLSDFLANSRPVVCWLKRRLRRWTVLLSLEFGSVGGIEGSSLFNSRSNWRRALSH